MNAGPTSFQLSRNPLTIEAQPSVPTLASSGCVNELRGLEAIGPVDYDVGHQPRVSCAVLRIQSCSKPREQEITLGVHSVKINNHFGVPAAASRR